jgi:hypothetical protein
MFPDLQDKKMQLRHLSAILVFILSFTLMIGQASADTQSSDYFSTKISPEEQALFAFFRAANVPPDYEYWISSSVRYKTLDEAQKQDFMIKEMLRLGRGYGLYDLNTDVLELKAPVVAKYYPAKDGGQPSLKFRFFNLGRMNVPTFDFPFGSSTVSLVVNNINAFSDLALSPEQDQAVRAKIPYENDEFDANLIIHTRIDEADFSQPIEENKKTKRWLMVGKIAYIKCEVDSFYMQQKSTLWDFVSPWYEEQFRVKNMPEEEKYPHPFDLFK